MPNNAFLFHNYETLGHQIDTIFVCEYFILIIEIKNVSGFIWYEEDKHQFIRKKKTGEIEGFQSPVEQVKRHAEFIEGVVRRLGLSVPVHKAVVIAEPTTVIGKIPGEIPIFHAIGLRTEVKKLLLKYKKPLIADVHFELLKQELLKLYYPGTYRPRFEIPPIRKGAICTCGRIMQYKRGKFFCTCGIESKEALLQGLHDYRLLLNEWITNREFRDFFLIESEDTVNKILKRLDFHYEGKNKNRRYLIRKDIWRIN